MAENLPAAHQRVPPELWEEIYLYCYHDHSLYTSRRGAPFNISSTCQRWRDIATYIPSLWSSLRVEFTRSDSRPPLPVLEEWLNRSKSYPLTFSLVYVDEGAAARPVEEEEILDHSRMWDTLSMLSKHLLRWEKVYFDLSQLPAFVEFPSTFPFSESKVPVLKIQDLQLRSFDYHHRHNGRRLIPAVQQWISSLMGCAPSLDTFASYGPGRLDRLVVPWDQLTSLKLEAVTANRCLKILEVAPKLVSCHFGIKRVREPSFQLPLGITHRKLCRLSITADVDVGDFFEPLMIPGLQELEIAVTAKADREQWHQQAELLAFLARSYCPLEVLTLRRPSLTENVLFQCLSRVPSLKHLEITFNSQRSGELVGDRLVEKMTVPGRPLGIEKGTSDPNELICPALESLILIRCISESLEDGLLGRMIESRWNAARKPSAVLVAKLAHLQIEFHSEDHWVDNERLQALHSRGLLGKTRASRDVTLRKPVGLVRDPPARVPVLPLPHAWGGTK
ncbi:hypothetical protein Moror_5193 [Moniliophthora roreri MCA 2997]|uniref:F-box domain-containing protein n=2 Tax=Moniliophthora roreri TaxID=221103 RepID=V2WQV2_MONRO|nr:hypothetical protein Moror_5193 [Moniliophthora roreri MCA 2997]KAI3610037.1 hypothetical protein WG66_007383 [Moniliophthora roreri]